MTDTLSLTPIGTIHCQRKYRGETPRQSVDATNVGEIKLLPNQNFEAALDDLAGFDRIWVIFGFHLNFERSWRPKTAPPLVDDKKRIGLFATRSPYRPNPIGMSCVELTGVSGLTLAIRNFDMLDGTPVYDIKPYIPRSDSFPEASTGWLPQNIDEYQVTFSVHAAKQAELILELLELDLIHFARTQLSYDPLNQKRKRISHCSDNHYYLACRTWRIFYRIDEQQITVTGIASNYTTEELSPDAPDPYQDKDAHREFVRCFNLL